jgi:hypothetical protein
MHRALQLIATARPTPSCEAPVPAQYSFARDSHMTRAGSPGYTNLQCLESSVRHATPRAHTTAAAAVKRRWAPRPHMLAHTKKQRVLSACAPPVLKAIRAQVRSRLQRHHHSGKAGPGGAIRGCLCMGANSPRSALRSHDSAAHNAQLVVSVTRRKAQPEPKRPGPPNCPCQETASPPWQPQEIRGGSVRAPPLCT